MLIAALAAVTLIAWTVAYFAVIRPKLKEYKATAGIYAKIEAFEGTALGKAKLHMRGSKTAVAGFLTSIIPIFGTVLDGLNGVKWDAIFPTERAAAIASVIALAVAIGPMVMVIAHMTGIVEAAKATPAAPAAE